MRSPTMLEAQSGNLPRQVRFGPAFGLVEWEPLSFVGGTVCQNI